MNNIFSSLIMVLNTIPVTGEENQRKMLMVIDTLRRMEKAANKPEKESEVTADG